MNCCKNNKKLNKSKKKALYILVEKTQKKLIKIKKINNINLTIREDCVVILFLKIEYIITTTNK